MSKHFWQYQKLTETRRDEVKELISLATNKSLRKFFCFPSLTVDKASKAFAIYISERMCQDSFNMRVYPSPKLSSNRVLAPKLSVNSSNKVLEMLGSVRESTLIKYSHHIPWLDEILYRSENRCSVGKIKLCYEGEDNRYECSRGGCSLKLVGKDITCSGEHQISPCERISPTGQIRTRHQRFGSKVDRFKLLVFRAQILEEVEKARNIK
jgi:hypothetical protein